MDVPSLIDTQKSCYELHLASEGQMLKTTSPAEATHHGGRFYIHDGIFVVGSPRYNGITNITSTILIMF